MLPFLESIPQSIQKIIQLSSLVSKGLIRSYGLLLYGDYTNTRQYPVTTFSGWLSASEALEGMKPLLSKVSSDLVPGGILI